jgi:hypothetical protein
MPFSDTGEKTIEKCISTTRAGEVNIVLSSTGTFTGEQVIFLSFSFLSNRELFVLHPALPHPHQ